MEFHIFFLHKLYATKCELKVLPSTLDRQNRKKNEENKFHFVLFSRESHSQFVFHK